MKLIQPIYNGLLVFLFLVLLLLWFVGWFILGTPVIGIVYMVIVLWLLEGIRFLRQVALKKSQNQTNPDTHPTQTEQGDIHA